MISIGPFIFYATQKNLRGVSFSSKYSSEQVVDNLTILGGNASEGSVLFAEWTADNLTFNTVENIR